jgi:hypothetical protein
MRRAALLLLLACGPGAAARAQTPEPPPAETPVVAEPSPVASPAPTPSPSPSASPKPSPSAAATGGFGGRLRLALRGTLRTGSSFDEEREFTESVETGRVASTYSADLGVGGEIAAGWQFTRHVGVALAFSAARRNQSGTFTASIPHPLYFDQDRAAEGSLGGGTVTETALHLDLALVGGTGAVEWSLFGGPSVVRVNADLLSSLQYTQSYPFDSVTVTGTPLVPVRGRAAGFNVGGSADWRVGRRTAVGTQVRYTRAVIGLRPDAVNEVEVTAGGLQIGAGVRLAF